MATKLYVGNLPFNTTDDQMKELFSQAGEVSSAQIIIEKMSGRSKGFGFVEMATEEGAQAAVEKFNGYEFNGRRLTVAEARPMEPRAPRSNGGGGNRGGGFNRGGFSGGRNDNY